MLAVSATFCPGIKVDQTYISVECATPSSLRCGIAGVEATWPDA